MRAKAASFFQHPRWVAALVIVIAVTIWSISFCSIAGQISHSFPGLFHTPHILLRFISGHISLVFTCVTNGVFAHLLPTN